MAATIRLVLEKAAAEEQEREKNRLDAERREPEERQRQDAESSAAQQREIERLANEQREKDRQEGERLDAERRTRRENLVKAREERERLESEHGQSKADIVTPSLALSQDLGPAQAETPPIVQRKGSVQVPTETKETQTGRPDKTMNKEPLLVHVVFHPESDEAREMARHIHRQLNSDLIVPGLRMPTVFCPTRDGGAPYARLRFDFAKRNFVVLLADDRLSIDEAWCGFCAEAWESCQNSNGRCVPFQLTENAWPLDARLKEVSFAKAFLQAVGEARKRIRCASDRGRALPLPFESR